MISILAAPTNLGLRPPEPGAVPGTAKAPEALRDAGLYRRLIALGAADAGVVLPGRYLDDVEVGAPRARNQKAIVEHAIRLAARIGDELNQSRTPLILGGDCSLLLGAGLALSRRGRFGLVHIDGHTDFRHPDNTSQCASVAGEDLAVAVGRHRAALADIEGRRPYFRPDDTVHIGYRETDEHVQELRGVVSLVVSAQEVREMGGGHWGRRVLDLLKDRGTSGYWLHLDVDVLDPIWMPAVDSPTPGGLAPAELMALLTELVPSASGAEVTIFDPDLDPDGKLATFLTDLLATGLSQLGMATA
ncbi:Arginase/agmatinase/formiminoglutamase [mine drainage metagenome]|uniref:Arginase/agmatinase/formiminoglutamase n=2 Tax=mine drainage metagenome TaxID=410659 RepID=T1BT74_9ZZZZ